MAGGSTRWKSRRRCLAAALGATAWLVVGAVAVAAGDGRAIPASSGAGPSAAPDARAALGVGPRNDATDALHRADATRAPRPAAVPPGWSCTPGQCRPRAAAPVRDAAAFGMVLAGAGWIARRRPAAGS